MDTDEEQFTDDDFDEVEDYEDYCEEFELDEDDIFNTEHIWDTLPSRRYRFRPEIWCDLVDDVIH